MKETIKMKKGALPRALAAGSLSKITRQIQDVRADRMAGFQALLWFHREGTKDQSWGSWRSKNQLMPIVGVDVALKLFDREGREGKRALGFNT